MKEHTYTYTIKVTAFDESDAYSALESCEGFVEADLEDRSDSWETNEGLNETFDEIVKGLA